jgi:hypothetical protein
MSATTLGPRLTTVLTIVHAYETAQKNDRRSPLQVRWDDDGEVVRHHAWPTGGPQVTREI